MHWEYRIDRELIFESLVLFPVRSRRQYSSGHRGVNRHSSSCHRHASAAPGSVMA